jgi:ABC-type branched-subunit amino acid transport system substrate-binding protein
MAMVVAATLLLAACGGDDDDDEGTGPATNGASSNADCDFEGDEIPVGTEVATGPLVGEQFLDFVPGVRARLEMENAAGGIDGRKFTIVEREAPLDPTVVTQNMTELVEQENVSALLSADPAQPAAAQYLNDQGVPVIGFAINQVWGQFDNMTGYGGDTFPDVYAPPAPSSLFEYAVDELGATHLASFGFAQSEESMASAENVATSWELSGGADATVYEANFGATDFTADAQQLLDDGVDAIAGSITRDSFIQLVLAARQADVDLKFVQTPTGYEETTLEQNGGELAGVYLGNPFAPFELERPGHEEFLDAMAEYSPDRPAKQQLAMVGYLSADLLVESIKAGGCPTREAILEGMSSLEGYDGRGLIEPWDVGAGQGTPQLCGWSLRVSDDGSAFEPQFDGEPQCLSVDDFQR